MKTVRKPKIIRSLLLSTFAVALFSSQLRAQGHLSISAGPDFATFQVLKDGKTNPLYSDDNLKIGIAVPYSLTVNYSYGTFISTAVSNNDPQNLNFMLGVATGGYVGYEVSETIKLSAILGFGILGNSQPFTYSFGQNGLTNEFTDYTNSSVYVDLQGRYEKFGLKLTSFSDILQVFATYHFTEKLFVGIGSRRLNRVLVTNGNNSAFKTPSSIQATFGLALGK